MKRIRAIDPRAGIIADGSLSTRWAGSSVAV